MFDLIVHYWTGRDMDRAYADHGERAAYRNAQHGDSFEPCKRVAFYGRVPSDVVEAYSRAGIPVEFADVPVVLEPNPTPAPVPGTEYDEAEELAAAVAFGSEQAMNLAIAGELVPSDFTGVKPSGKTGYTKPDVLAVIAKKAG